MRLHLAVAGCSGLPLIGQQPLGAAYLDSSGPSAVMLWSELPSSHGTMNPEPTLPHAPHTYSLDSEPSWEYNHIRLQYFAALGIVPGTTFHVAYSKTDSETCLEVHRLGIVVLVLELVHAHRLGFFEELLCHGG
jgi:hypothetical protein